MAIPVLPDVEALIIWWLDQAAIALGGVHDEYPANPSYPFLVVARIGGKPKEPRWLDRASIQLDAYGETKEQARDLAATANASLLDLDETNGVIDTGDVSGVVTGVLIESALPWQPDDTTDTARYLSTVTVYAHP
jgi:hypothetical protein